MTQTKSTQLGAIGSSKMQVFTSWRGYLYTAPTLLTRGNDPEETRREFHYSFQAFKRPTLPQVEQQSEALPGTFLVRRQAAATFRFQA
jgi:hypothetical protein